MVLAICPFNKQQALMNCNSSSFLSPTPCYIEWRLRKLVGLGVVRMKVCALWWVTKWWTTTLPPSMNEATSVCLKQGTIRWVIKCIPTVPLRYLTKYPIRIEHSSLFLNQEKLPVSCGNSPPSPPLWPFLDTSLLWRWGVTPYTSLRHLPHME